jgi:hypothetical protein
MHVTFGVNLAKMTSPRVPQPQLAFQATFPDFVDAQAPSTFDNTVYTRPLLFPVKQFTP